jgi:protein O-GlcNAc transferase
MQEPQQLLAQATALHRRGRMQEAEQLYLQILQAKPDYFEAAHSLALLRLQQGCYREGLAPAETALKLKPDAPATAMVHATILHMLGRHDAALASYERALALRPEDAEAHYWRGNALAALSRYQEAIVSYERALAKNPRHVEALDNRGNALALVGRNVEALASYERLLAVEPAYAGGWYNRGTLLIDFGRADEALASYDRALALWPRHAGALNGRGTALHALGRFEEALASYRRALEIEPASAATLYNQGGAEQALGRHEEALASFERALALKPDYAEALYARGASLHAVNRWRESIACFERLLSLKPDDPSAKLALCMAELPILYADEAEIAERRAAYAARLESLAAEVASISHPGDLAESVGARQPFFLAYQGRNDRDLQAIYGACACRVMADRYPGVPLPPPPAPGEPVRVGIVSGHFRRHANWRIPIGGWLGELDRSRFRLFGYHTGAESDAQTQRARSLCERFVQGPLSIERWRQEIAADAPHVLIYPEVGMSPVSAKLAAQRLAPVQCNSWGHPDTSGFPTLDYFLSSDLMEPPDAQQHYCEKLIRLPNLSVYCEPIEPPALAVERGALGMRPSACVYWCAQSLYKYLPQHDPVFARIAREAGDCQFVFVEYPGSAQVTGLFRLRLERAFSQFGLRGQDHCVILPRLEQERFLAATGLADVFLDSIGWSGCNSTLEALACDLPIVTMRGDLMRGRHSAAMLDMMGMSAAICMSIDEYVELAVRLARDLGSRAEFRRKIAAGKHAIYRDRSCIAALEAFLDQVARALPKAL